MRKIIYSMFAIILLLICSMALVSCEAITAQNININSGSGMIGGMGMDGGPGKSGQRINGDQEVDGNSVGNENSMNEMMNADCIGRIISVDGNSIRIELLEQTQNNKPLNFNDAKQGAKDNQNNNKLQKGFSENMPGMNDTGVEKTIIINDDVNISQRLSMERQNNNLKSEIKISDLKKGGIIMLWYKENTETVKRISVLQY